MNDTWFEKALIFVFVQQKSLIIFTCPSSKSRHCFSLQIIRLDVFKLS